MSPVETHEQRLRQTDAFAWNMERDPLLRSTIVAVATFDRVPDWDRLVERMERATRLSPNFRRRLVASPLKLAPPRFRFDPDFELGWHLRRVSAPAPHTLDTVLEFARIAGMAAFDPARPLWECTLIDGLAGDRAALVMKVHHSLTDGIGGIQIAQHVVDLQAEPTDLGPMPRLSKFPPGGGLMGPAGLTGVAEALAWDLTNVVGVGLRRLAALPGDAVRAAWHPRDAIAGMVEDVRSIAEFVRPVTHTRSSLMTERRLSWHYQILECSTAELKRAGHVAGGSLNDAFIGAVTGGLRRYHEEFDRHVDLLRLTMPISLRTGADPEGGNRVHHRALRRPGGHRGPGGADGRDRTGLCSPTARARRGLLRGHRRHPQPGAQPRRGRDAQARRLPGQQRARADPDGLAGRRPARGLYAFGPTLGASANVTLMSYGDTCCVGVNVDTGAVVDADLFLDCLVEGFEEVLGVGGQHQAVRLGRLDPLGLDSGGS